MNSEQLCIKMTISNISNSNFSNVYSARNNTSSKGKASSQSSLGNYGRIHASSGLWLVTLIPLACCPGFYAVHSSCKPSPSILSIYAIQVGISSLYILYDFYYKQAKSEVGLGSKFSKNRILFLVTHPLLPVVVSFVALGTYTQCNNPAVYICAYICWYLQQKLTKWIFNHFTDSFSVGESVLMGQAASLTIAVSLKGLLNSSQFKSENKQLFSFVQIAVIVATSFGYILWRWRGKLGILSFFIFLAGMSGLGIGLSSFLLQEWTLVWLTNLFLSPTRMALVGWWMNVFVIMIITTFLSQRYPYVPQTVLRKVFHLLMVLIIVPGIIMDPSLTYLAATGATIFFILLEIVRMAKVEPLSGLLNSLFYSFLDEKDQGSLVLSHIYLLGALTLPLWLYPCDFLHTEGSSQLNAIENAASKVQFCVLPLLAGVLSVGVGDTAASIGGTYLGRHRFPGTKKTVEGSVCNVICQIAFVCFLVQLGSVKVWWDAWPRLVLAVILSSVVEAFTNQVDNVVLPLLLYTPLMDP